MLIELAIEQAKEDRAKELVQRKEEIETLRVEVNELLDFRSTQFIKEQKIKTMKEYLEFGRMKHNLELTTIEKEKFEDIERMRKDMLVKIKEVKTAMLSLNEDKLHGTTRLTIKQNK